MIYASQQLIHGYRVCKLVSYEGKFIWKLYCFSDTPILITLPSSRPDNFMKTGNFFNDFYYLDFFESDLNGD